ncbi:hypothetical protein ACFO0N_21320 [Halobium salinum]|uniref:Uncharacterized protein n=1 Tax=Halobium salinum TaxID=1364940 RepID=A0ABD5PI60_9EURY
MRSKSRRYLKAVVISIGAFVLFGIVTGLIPNPLYIRQVPRTPLDYLFLITTAAFLGIYTLQRTNNEHNDEKTATAGTVVGFLAFGCPICNAFLLALFSSSALMTYLDPLRPLLGIVSVVFFAGLLYSRSQSSCDTCGIEERGNQTH